MIVLPWSDNYGVRTHEAGGSDELQTDVMRFMAILALCLVAVFALVRSIPLGAPVPVDSDERTPHDPIPPAPPAHETLAPPQARPAPTLAAPLPAQAPAPAQPANAAPDAALELPGSAPPRPAAIPPAAPAASSPPAEPAAPAPLPAPAQVGFTLHFATDAALRGLVAQGQVHLFAIESGQSWALQISSRGSAFVAQPAPPSLHLMPSSDVPADIRSAFARDTGVRAVTVETWGVTLPADTRRQIDALLASHSGGALVIDAGGRVDLEARR